MLGPLVATAVTLELGRYDRARLRRRGDGLAIGDSKRTSAFGKMAHAEGLAMALAERILGRPPGNADDLLGAFAIDGLLPLRACCPDASSRAQCWSEPLPLPAFGGDLVTGRALLARLEGRALRVRRIRSAIFCAGSINAAHRRGQHQGPRGSAPLRRAHPRRPPSVRPGAAGDLWAGLGHPEVPGVLHPPGGDRSGRGPTRLPGSERSASRSRPTTDTCQSGWLRWWARSSARSPCDD